MKKFFDLNSPIMRFLARFVDLIILNTLFILTSLPLLTMGASWCALQTSIQNILHKKDGKILQNYFRIFRSNLKQATLAWLGILIIGFILFSDFRLIGRLPIVLEFFLGAAAIVCVIVVLSEAVYIFAYIGRYKDNLRTAVKNIFALSLQNWFQTIFLLIYNSFIVYFSLSSPAALLTMIYVFTFGGIAILNYFSGIMIKQVFDKIELDKIERRKNEKK